MTVNNNSQPKTFIISYISGTVATVNGPINIYNPILQYSVTSFDYIDSKGNEHRNTTTDKIQLIECVYKIDELKKGIDFITEIKRLPEIIFGPFNYPFIDRSTLFHLMISVKSMTIENVRMLIGTSKELYLIKNHRSFQKIMMGYLKSYYRLHVTNERWSNYLFISFISTRSLHLRK
jgi:hypothetical protein